LGLGGVIWIPAGVPPHRAPPAASAGDRLAMVRLATAGHTEYLIDPGEIEAGVPSYTVPTLERLRRSHGLLRPLVLLMGADAFLGLAGWHRWHDLFALAHLGVVSRPGFPLAAERMPGELAEQFLARQRPAPALTQAAAGHIATFTMEAGTVSSTAVRAALAAGQGVRELLPPPVVDYISAHRLYRP
jgi:nicotinate-nucleotide adenylyltransferase